MSRIRKRSPRGLSKRFISGAALLLFFMVLALLRPYIGPYIGLGGDDAVVARVIDGDTVDMVDGRRVRYQAIDTAEMDAFSVYERRLANDAKALNSRLVEGKVVRLTFDRQKKDKYGRTLAYVWVGDGYKTLVNEELVRAGLARAKTYDSDPLWYPRLAAIEAEAKARGLGLWAPK